MQLLALCVALYLCAFVQVTTGFGFQILAMPLLTLLIGLDQAAPLVAAAGVLVAASNVVRLHRHVHRGELGRLMLAALAGIPLGFWAQTHVPADTVRLTLGGVIIAYALYALIQPQTRRVLHARWAYPAGLVAGLLGAAYNVPGPPLIVYGTQRVWPRDTFRATLQSFFLLSGVFVVCGHAALGHYTASTGELVLLAVPVLIVGNLSGVYVDRYIDARRFQQLVKALMLVMGILLLI
jgi:uncharacterized membrane protein YfcA